MRHFGDITKLNGAEIHVVDCVTGGSPCQDLSVAGKRAGLDGERSGLFMEQIRIVKEMRKKEMENGRTVELVRPRWMVWENVPGAFSSNGGKDFQAVLTEIVRIVSPECPDVPMPKDGKWSKAGCLYDELGRWSIAWRVHDAQFWGVPQRRKRIALVADFGGMCAPEVLFERKGLSRNTEPCGEAGQETAGGTGKGADIAISIQGNTIDRDAKENGSGVSVGVSHTLNGVDRHGVMCLNDQGGSVMGVSEDVIGALRAEEHGHKPVVAFTQNQRNEVRNLGEVAGALAAEPGMKQQTYVAIHQNASGGNTVPTIYDARGNGNGVTVPTLTGDHQNRVTDYTALCVGNGQMCNITMKPLANTLDTMHDQQAVMVAAVDCRNLNENHEVVGTIQSKENGGYSLNYQNPVRINAIVRRLTPLECERLQGYPDGWTDIGEWVDTKGKKHKVADSPRYKALGNSIALPFWFYLLRRISATYERPATLGSLFDGIGGFPLCWERCNGKGTAVWASEIEEFPIAVTKNRFPDLEVQE